MLHTHQCEYGCLGLYPKYTNGTLQDHFTDYVTAAEMTFHTVAELWNFAHKFFPFTIHCHRGFVKVLVMLKMQNINFFKLILILTFKYWLGSNQHVSEKHFHMHNREVIISTLSLAASHVHCYICSVPEGPLP